MIIGPAIIGSAIISQDGFIADTNYSMHKIAHDKDFQLLQQRLNTYSGVCVMGRVTHELHPNKNLRQRYILSSCSQEDSDVHHFFENTTLLFNTIQQQKDQAVHILGGSHIYTHFGQNKLYDAFYLSIRKDVTLNDGKPLCLDKQFSNAQTLMQEWGLTMITKHDQTAPNLEILQFKR